MKNLKDKINQETKEKEEMIETKDAELRKLRERIDEMSSEFAQMLKDVLGKMSERVDFANQSWEGDQGDILSHKVD